MAVPTIVGSPTQNSGAGSLTITLGAGLSIVCVVTQAQNLPSGSTNLISDATSGWAIIPGGIGTQGGAGLSGAGQYIYVFYKVTTNGETITTGDSGVFQVYQALTVSGYNTSTPIEKAASPIAQTATAGGLFTFTSLGGGTNGPDRLYIGFFNPRVDTATALAGTPSSSVLTGPSATLIGSIQTNLGSGGGIVGLYGGLPTASTSDPSATITDATYASALYRPVALAVVPAPATVTGSGTLSGSGSMSATGTRKTFGTSAAISGSGSLAATGTRKTFGSGSLDGSGSLVASGTRQTFGSGTLTASADLAATGARTTFGTALILGTATLTATGVGTSAAPSGIRRMFVADPLLTGSPFRSSIDLTE